MSLKSKPVAKRRAAATTFVYRDDAVVEADQVLRLFRQAPWAKTRTREDAQEMLRHTDLLLTVWDGETLVGFGRVLTDYVYRATIWDVIVDKPYQGCRIGTELVQRILHHPKLSRVELFWLCTRRPGFYERLGFDATQQTGMVWTRDRDGGGVTQ